MNTSANGDRMHGDFGNAGSFEDRAMSKKTIVVTGANGGLGKAICGKLSEEGATAVGLDGRLTSASSPLPP
jgi:hypothetical protein